MIVGVGGDDLPWSLSADIKSCTPLASLPSALSASCMARAADHTYVCMIVRSKRFLNSTVQCWSYGQQKPAYMRVPCPNSSVLLASFVALWLIEAANLRMRSLEVCVRISSNISSWPVDCEGCCEGAFGLSGGLTMSIVLSVSSSTMSGRWRESKRQD